MISKAKQYLISDIVVEAHTLISDGFYCEYTYLTDSQMKMSEARERDRGDSIEYWAEVEVQQEALRRKHQR